MKNGRTRRPSALLALSLAGLLFLMMPASVLGATPAATVTGPATVRAGDTIKVAVKIGGTGLRAVQGEIQYDAAVLSFRETGGLLSGWGFEEADSSVAGKFVFIIMDKQQEAPIDSTKQLFTLTFQVRSAVAAGDTIRVLAAKLAASDGVDDFYPADASYSVQAAAPLSGNTDLASLTVANATLEPAFGKGTTSYTVSVPFDVSSLDLVAKAADAKAKVSVSGNSLAAGGTTDVAVTVTAESGAKKTYTIRVTRAQDPNYVASGDNALVGLSVEGFLLSPPFEPERLDYVIWLPYEVEQVAVSGTPADGKAAVAVEGAAGFAAGQGNAIRVVCTAEDGTTRTYTIAAMRAAAHGDITGTPPATPEPTGELTGEPTGEPTAAPSGEATGTPAAEGTPTPTGGGNPSDRDGPPIRLEIWEILVLALALAGLGYGAALVFGKGRKGAR